MTRVRKVAAVSLMTPMAAAAITFGLGEPAGAAAACPPLASATINAPTGTVAVGSTVHVSAQISGLMLLQAHLQVSGPGLNQQVGNSVMSGSISGNVTVPQAGTYTLAVVGNGTKCTYKSADFTAKKRAVASPTQSNAPGSPSRPGGSAGKHSAGNGANPLPTGAGHGTGAGGGYGLPLNGASPFSLPPVAPDGTAQGFAYPTPEPQVASPPTQPVARSVSETPPVKWGQSLAIALVLLVISAHLGMWSRRQRLAAEGANTTRGRGGRRRAGRKTPSESANIMAATATATATATPTEPVDAAPDVARPTSAGSADSWADDADRAMDVSGGERGIDAGTSPTARPHADVAKGETGDMTARTDSGTGRHADADTEPISTHDFADRDGRASGGSATGMTGRNPADAASADGASSFGGLHEEPAGERSKRSGGRGYQGRRRRD